MTRLKVGVIGCGAIAQVWHLPHLRELDRLFEIRALCDLSRQLLVAVGDEYGGPPERRFVEKPMCTTEREARDMADAADRAGVVMQVGYMKRHDPAYQYAKARYAEMS